MRPTSAVIKLIEVAKVLAGKDLQHVYGIPHIIEAAAQVGWDHHRRELLRQLVRSDEWKQAKQPEGATSKP